MFSIPFVYISCALIGSGIAAMLIRKQNQPQAKFVPIKVEKNIFDFLEERERRKNR